MKSLSELSRSRVRPGPVVVIDVFRAFTVAPLALAAGAEKIVLVETLYEARSLKRETIGSMAIKDGPPSEGFDLANSPAALAEADVVGRTIFQTTTSGTRGALAVRDCAQLFCASFVCASATANALRLICESATYVITGANGFAQEDLACAEYIDALIASPTVEAGPDLHRVRTSRAADDLRKGVHLGYRGVHPDDIDLCLQVDRVDFACLGSR